MWSEELRREEERGVNEEVHKLENLSKEAVILCASHAEQVNEHLGSLEEN